MRFNGVSVSLRIVGFPMVEAMAYGLPVNCGGYASLIAKSAQMVLSTIDPLIRIMAAPYSCMRWIPAIRRRFVKRH
jgi:hypothetical protein